MRHDLKRVARTATLLLAFHAGPVGAEPARGGTLRVVVPQLPVALDPVVSTLGTNWLVAANVCEGLFGLDEAWQPQPMLAASSAYDPAGPTLIVTLRPGIPFHSGAALTSADVVASLTRYAGSAGTGAVMKSLVKEIKADGTDKVVFVLNGPTGIVPGLLSLTPAVIMSQASLRGHGPAEATAELDCTGPYKVAAFQPDRAAELVRFDGYQSRTEPSSASSGAKHAYADRIVFSPQAEPSVRRDSLITGAADIATTLPFDFYETLKGNPGTEPLVIKDNQSLTLVMNTKQGPLANPKLRLAIYRALTMEPMMRAAVGNPEFYAVDPSWVPDRHSVWYTRAGADGFGKPDPTLAKKLLDEAGYKGEKLRWLTSKDFYQEHYLPALTAAQQLKRAGINVDLQVMPAATYIQTRTDPAQFEMFSSFLPTYVDPVVIPYLNASYPGFWSDAGKTDLVTKLAATTDSAARVELWHKIQERIYADMPFIKFGTEGAFSGLRKGVTGKTTSPAASDFYFNVAPPPG